MGRDKVKQYQYSSLEDGCKYLRSYDSMTEIYNKYYDGSKYPLYQYSNDFHKLPNDTYISTYRIGRAKLIKCIRSYNDPTIYKRKGDRKINIYNADGELVGSVNNFRIIEAILNAKKKTVLGSLHRGNIGTTVFGNLNYIYEDDNA